MVLKTRGEFMEPEQTQLSENLPLIRNRRRQDDIESADAIRGDDQQCRLTHDVFDLINIADLSPPNRKRQCALRQGGGHYEKIQRKARKAKGRNCQWVHDSFRGL